jgi:hypothetical protein
MTSTDGAAFASGLALFCLALGATKIMVGKFKIYHLGYFVLSALLATVAVAMLAIPLPS